MAKDRSAQGTKLTSVRDWLGWIESVAKLPRLEPLSAALPAGQSLDAQALSPNVRSAAREWANLFRDLADSYGLSLLGLEMAVIADKRQQRLGEPSSFSSFVTMFAEDPDRLLDAYQKCIKRALEEPDGNVGCIRYPIVVHPSLYSGETGYFHTPIGPTYTRADYKASNGSLRAIGYPLTEPDLSAPDRSIETQLDDVARILRSSEDPTVTKELASATMVLLPFVRPKFSLAVKIGDSAKAYATPGGCLFFIFRDPVEDDPHSLGLFLSSARWVLSEASAAESDSAYEAVTRQREFAASMLHGTVSVVSAIGTSNLIDLLFDGERNKDVLSVDDLIADFGNFEGADHHKTLVVNQIQAMLVAETLAKGLAGLAEIYVEDGILRGKFLSREPQNLRAVVDRAWSMATAGSEKHVSIVRGERDEPNQDWVLPSGYVSEHLIASIIMEMFRNAIVYGLPAPSEQIVNLSIYEDNGSVTVHMENDRQGTAASEKQLSGFLTRVRMLLDKIPGLDLFTVGRGDTYHATLILGEIQTTGPASKSSDNVAIKTAQPLRQDRRIV